MGEFRPADTAHNTSQPWGEQPVTPYTQADIDAWVASIVGPSEEVSDRVPSVKFFVKNPHVTKRVVEVVRRAKSREEEEK